MGSEKRIALRTLERLSAAFATIRAVGIIPFKCLATPEASGRLQILTRGVNVAALIGDMAASFAQDERLPFSSPEDRNKEKADVVVNAGKISLTKSAVGTNSRLVFKTFPFGADASNENHLVRSSTILAKYNYYGSCQG